jgi:hypothetical protein
MKTHHRSGIPFSTLASRASFIAGLVCILGLQQARCDGETYEFPVSNPPTNKYRSLPSHAPYGNKVKLTVVTGKVVSNTPQHLIMKRRKASFLVEAKPLATWTAYPMVMNVTKDFRIEEQDEDNRLNLAWIKFRPNDSVSLDQRPTEWIATYVATVDIAVDSDNSHSYGGVNYNDYVDDHESSDDNDPSINLVKILTSNTSPNTPTSTKPGWADFTACVEKGEKGLFASMHVHLHGFEPETKIKFLYDGNDPALVKPNPDGSWFMPNGSLRIWTQNVNASRKPQSIPTGHYITPNTSYSLDDLVKTKVSDGHFVFYVEAVQASTKPNGQTVEVQIQPANPQNSAWVSIDKVDLLPVQLITPAGDPVNAAVEGGSGASMVPDGANEFTFSDATPGVLMIKLKAKVSGIASLPVEEQSKFSFELDSIGDSSFAWNAANPKGKAVVNGDFITATATYTGLPKNNSDFGLKRARVKYDARNAGEAPFEVFFARDARNHPGSDSNNPNWLYYYSRLVNKLVTNSPDPNYVPRNKGGQSQYDPNTNTITLDEGAIQPYNPYYGTNGELKGIDTFFWCYTHEMQHYKDWEDFWNVSTQGLSKWQAAWGKSGPSGNLDKGDFPNSFEDIDANGAFNAGDPYDLTTQKTATNPSGLADNEDRNCKLHKAVTGDHSKDWANPGMQHKTLNKYDD